MSLIKPSLSEDEDFSVLLRALEGWYEGIDFTFPERSSGHLRRVLLKSNASIFR